MTCMYLTSLSLYTCTDIAHITATVSNGDLGLKDIRTVYGPIGKSLETKCTADDKY